MSYLVLARKFRPQTFIEVSGQEHVTRSLKNAITRNRVAHAYLLSGPRGVGKTTIARVFAKGLNCEKGSTSEPCAVCTNCVEIARGSNLAVREIDGASHNSVDNVRELIESFRAAPPPGSRYKVYIIDEVHMFSMAAFNALLKSLEEPPPHTVFILATTEAHKIPDTVLSRCQRFDLRALSSAQVAAKLHEICEKEKILMDPEALRMVVRLSEGSLRDAESLLERVNSFCDGTISAEATSQVLGLVQRNVLFELAGAIFERNAERVLALSDTVFSGGIDPGSFFREFVAIFREILFAKYCEAAFLEREGFAADEVVALKRLSAASSDPDLQDLLSIARTGCDEAMRSAFPRVCFESLVVRMATREPALHIAELLSTLSAQKGIASAPPVSSEAVPRRETTAPVKAASPAPASRRSPSAAPNAHEERSAEGEMLDWGGFVREVTSSGSKMIAEYLKRVSVTRFELHKGKGLGVIEGTGAEFTIQSLTQAETKKKLIESLTRIVGGTSWEISLSSTGASSSLPSDSLLHQEQEQKKIAKVQKQEGISNHPKIKSLQKVFPGSQIENIKVKE